MKLIFKILNHITPACIAFLLNFNLSTQIFAEEFIYPDLSGAIPKMATPFKEGDRIAYIGDSITYAGGGKWGKYHSDIFKYYVTRYPNTKITYFNDGIGGNRLADVLNRFEWDIMEDKPNRATIMLGMNDIERWLHRSGAAPGFIKKQEIALDLYKANMEKLVGMLKAKGVRVMLIGPTIFDNTLPHNWTNQPGANDSLAKCSAFLKELAAKNGLEYADFNAPMLIVNSFIQSKDPKASIVGGDRVHPGATGHLMMTYSFLKSQGVAQEVAKVKIDVNDISNPIASNCEVTDVSAKNNFVSYTYKPLSLPYPVSANYMEIDKLVPFTEDLNKEVIIVSGLKDGVYKLEIDGVEVAKYLSDDLKEGINIAIAVNNPGQIQAQKVSKLIDERTKLEIDVIRKLRMFEADLAKSIDVLDAGAIKSFLAVEENAKKLSPWAKKNIKMYEAQKPEEQATYEKMTELESKSYEQAKPGVYKVNLTYIDSKENASTVDGLVRNRKIRMVQVKVEPPSK